jgi:RNA polymerase sigma-70 factor (ECF subfamily)
MSAVRAQGRSKRSAVIPMEAEQLSQFADPDDLATQIESRDEMRRVREALDSLSESQRQVVEMAFVDGLPYAEIAARLGVAEGTIKTRVARARSRLRVVLASNENTRPPPEES